MGALAVILFGGFVYAAYVLGSRDTVRPLYGFVLGWLFFPKYIQRLPVVGGLPWEHVRIFDFVEAIMGLVLVLAIVLRRGSPRDGWRERRRFRRLGLTLLVVGTVSLVCEFIYAGQGSYPGDDVPMRMRVRPMLTIVYGVIMLFGCLTFVRSLRHVTVILSLFALAGLELLFEVVFLYYLNLLPFLNLWVMHGSGRFDSISLMSFDAVGFVMIAAMSCAGFFVLRSRNIMRLGIVPLMFLPVIATLQKAPLTGALVSFGFLLWYGFRRLRVVLVIAVGWLVLFQSVTMTAIESGASEINLSLGGAERRNISALDTLTARAALWLRGVDLIAHNFPFGTGEGMTQQHMGAAIPQFAQDLIVGFVSRVDMRLFAAAHTTNVHNAYLEFIIEHGLFGFIPLVMFLAILGRNFASFVRQYRDFQTEQGIRIYTAEICVYAALFGIGWRFLFQSGNKYYFVLFIFLFLSSLLRRLRTEHQLELDAQAGDETAGIAVENPDGTRGPKVPLHIGSPIS